MKFRPYQQHQVIMFPNNLEELIPENHLIRIIDLIVEQLDFKKLYNSYSEEGQPGYHPMMLVKILLYGYSVGVRSSRKIAEKLLSDIYFMYLAGMQKPDFRTISDFRKNKKEYLIEYFKQVLQICKRMGLFSLGHVAIDGTKIEANSSRKMMLDKDDLLRLESNVEEKIRHIIECADKIDKEEDKKYGEDKRGEELPEELSGKEKLLEKIKQAKKHLEENNLKRVSLTDPESRIMLTNNRGTDICYNVQAAIDSEHQVILACKASSKEDDHGNLIPVYEEVVQNAGEKPKEVSADAGYQSGRIYNYLEKNKIDAYLPDCKISAETDESGKEIIGKFDRRKFIYNAIADTYTCPNEKQMKFKKNDKRNGVKFKIYKGQSCKDCKLRRECISKQTAKFREINIYENDKFKTEMRNKLLSTEGRIKYKKRMLIEAVFAHLKRTMLFRQFLLRGIEKTNCELSLLCTAYNIKKLWKQLSLETI
ncbi:MAG: IS1182 family transposase [Ignavibacteriales bacterium]|nr:IS1182 family transposase [Ignavibacteriales bacterium]